jgi:hypothetical protein
MVSFTVPVVVNHGVLCCVSGYELCCAMLVNIMGYTAPVAVDLICCASCCESW